MVVIQVNSIYLNKTTVMLFLPTVSCNQRRFSILLRPVGRQHKSSARYTTSATRPSPEHPRSRGLTKLSTCGTGACKDWKAKEVRCYGAPTATNL